MSRFLFYSCPTAACSRSSAPTGKTRKVMNTLNRRFGESDYLNLCRALAAEDEDKAQAVYRTVVDGLEKKVKEGHLFDNLSAIEIFRY